MIWPSRSLFLPSAKHFLFGSCVEFLCFLFGNERLSQCERQRIQMNGHTYTQQYSTVQCSCVLHPFLFFYSRLTLFVGTDMGILKLHLCLESLREDDQEPQSKPFLLFPMVFATNVDVKFLSAPHYFKSICTVWPFCKFCSHYFISEISEHTLYNYIESK